MELWHISMLSILPLLLVSGMGGGLWWRSVEPKVRCWAVMFTASLATYALPSIDGRAPLAAYACIDFLAVLAVTARPYFWPQKAIASGFLTMFVLDITALTMGDDGRGLFQSASVILGYLMWAILLIWGSRDASRGLSIYIWGDRRSPVGGADIAANRQGGGE